MINRNSQDWFHGGLLLVCGGMRIDLQVVQDVCHFESARQVFADDFLADQGFLLQTGLALSEGRFAGTADEEASFCNSWLSPFYPVWYGRVYNRRPVQVFLEMLGSSAFPEVDGALSSAPILEMMASDFAACDQKAEFECMIAFFLNLYMRGLPPPGNPEDKVFWFTKNLDSMDQLIPCSDYSLVVDFPRYKVLLSDLLDVPSVSSEKSDEKAPVRNAHVFPLPDFRSLISSLFAAKMHIAIDWNFVSERLAPELRDALADLILDEPESVCSVSIYTDGSFAATQDEKKSGWSFLAIATSEQEDFVLGYDWGVVETDPLAEGWTTTNKADSKAAEATAIFRALEWAFWRDIRAPHAACLPF